MIKEIGSHKFAGFHESIFSHSDEFIDMENQLKDEMEGINGNINIDDIQVYLEYVDWDKYKKDVCNKFMELYVEAVIDNLPFEIVDNNDFEFEIVEDTLSIVSPKYYNYSSDGCYCKVETNYAILDLIKEYTLGLEGCKDYIVNTFRSYDGFRSFIKNDFDYWKELPIQEYEERMIIALLDMLLSLSDEDIFNNINYDVIDAVNKYEYASPFVYYNDREYSLDKFYEVLCE